MANSLDTGQLLTVQRESFGPDWRESTRKLATILNQIRRL
jgi:hypothetical protein